jgi:hypothetical protein
MVNMSCTAGQSRSSISQSTTDWEGSPTKFTVTPKFRIGAEKDRRARVVIVVAVGWIDASVRTKFSHHKTLQYH